MIWWLRIRLIPAVVLALLLTMTMGAAAPSATVPVPVLTGSLTFSLPLPFLLPLLPVCLAVHGQARGESAAERVAVRSMPRLDVLVLSLLVAAAALTGAVESGPGDWPMGIAMARDFAGYLGTALLVRWVAGPGVATVSVALLPFCCTTFGVSSAGEPEIWAWPLHDPDSLPAATAALVLVLAGLLATLRTPLTVFHRAEV
ncbi:hypothetical protein HUT18_13625 [Streptomyces sp. NA04227]|uniref:hypothetical protein n=1 Tax=Streptomyces sp. NA04227 TaxID=2742136 RepID=UPI001591A80E|nr:hypothetical protein [Streptomyces sp. NA04227]QKW07276.1 hypothetical protein HUT18_13625 [Streptomyces sp. NA04227]